MMRNDHLYSVDNARRFRWSSLSGSLDPERVEFLRQQIVGKRVLDVGCGGGAYVEHLCKAGYETVGVDRSPDFLEVAKQRPNKAGQYVQGDIAALPFEDESFDSVICFDVLEHVDDESAMRELVRVAKQKVLIAVPKTDETFPDFGLCFSHYQDLTHLRTYTPATLDALLSATCPAQSKVHIELEGCIPVYNLIKGTVERRAYSRSWAQPLEPFIRHSFLFLARYVGFRRVPNGLRAAVTLP